MSVDIIHLRCFKAVFEELSFTRAAEVMYLSTPTLSLRIKALENHVGCKLFDRSTHVVRPTVEARRLYPLALEIIQGVDRLSDVIQGSKISSCVRVAIPDVLSRVIRRKLASFERDSYFLEFTQIPSPEIEEAILSHTVDLGISHLRAIQPSVADTELDEQVFSAIFDLTQSVGDEPHDRSGKPLNIAALSGFTLVGGPKHWHLLRETDLRTLREANITVDDSLTHTDVGGLMMNLRKHRRFALVPEASDLATSIDRDLFAVRRLEGICIPLHLQRRVDDQWVESVAEDLQAHLVES